MKVFLNHQEICVGSRVTLRDLLAGRSMTGDGTSVAVNNRIVDKEEWRRDFPCQWGQSNSNQICRNQITLLLSGTDYLESGV